MTDNLGVYPSSGIRERRMTEFVSGHPLKSAREISTLVTNTGVVLDREGLSAQIMQWGQYIAHEFTQLGEEESKHYYPTP